MKELCQACLRNDRRLMGCQNIHLVWRRLLFTESKNFSEYFFKMDVCYKYQVLPGEQLYGKRGEPGLTVLSK